MPFFEIENQSFHPIGQSYFDKEKQLQTLVERNLQVVINCRLVASEFPTGVQHWGRIDTLALSSEENNPVIVEYKKMKSAKMDG